MQDHRHANLSELIEHDVHVIGAAFRRVQDLRTLQDGLPLEHQRHGDQELEPPIGRCDQELTTGAGGTEYPRNDDISIEHHAHNIIYDIKSRAATHALQDHVPIQCEILLTSMQEGAMTPEEFARVSPGEVLTRESPWGMQNELARRSASRRTGSRDRRQPAADHRRHGVASQSVFRQLPEFWLHLQTNYDVQMARRQLSAAAAERIRAYRAA